MRRIITITMVFLLASCTTLPDINTLKSQQTQEQQARNVRNLTGYFSQEISNNNRDFLDAVKYAGESFSKISSAEAQRAEATGRALLSVYKRASALNTNYGRLLALEALKSHSNSKAPWAFKQLVTFLDTEASLPSASFQKQLILNQLNNQEVSWRPDTTTARKALKIVANMRVANTWQAYEIEQVRRIVTPDVVRLEIPQIGNELLNLYIEDFLGYPNLVVGRVDVADPA